MKKWENMPGKSIIYSVLKSAGDGRMAARNALLCALFSEHRPPLPMARPAVAEDTACCYWRRLPTAGAALSRWRVYSWSACISSAATRPIM